VQLLPPDTRRPGPGRRPLGPEKVDQLLRGPGAAADPGLTATVDLYQIKIADRILQTAASVRGAVSNPSLRRLNPQQAVFYYTNAPRHPDAGLDFVVDYRRDFGDAVFKDLSANFNTTKFLRIQSPPATCAAGLAWSTGCGWRLTSATEEQVHLLDQLADLAFDTNLRLIRYGEACRPRPSPRAARPSTRRVAALIVDLDVTMKITQQLSATFAPTTCSTNIRRRHSGQPGATAYTYYNTYSPYAFRRFLLWPPDLRLLSPERPVRRAPSRRDGRFSCEERLVRRVHPRRQPPQALVAGPWRGLLAAPSPDPRRRPRRLPPRRRSM